MFEYTASSMESCHLSQRPLSKELSELTDFAMLQDHIDRLPQEMKDEILFWLIRAALRPGKIYLDSRGKPHTTNPERCANNKKSSKLNISLLGLSKAMLKDSTKLLYEGNLWVIPSGIIEQEFFKSRDRRDLRLLPTVELQPISDDVDCWSYISEPNALVFESFYFTGLISRHPYFDLCPHYTTPIKWRLWLIDTWSDKRVTRGALLLDVEGHNFNAEGVNDADESLNLAPVPDCQPRRKTLFGVPWLEERSDQVLTFNDEFRRKLVIA